jgi:hypothetical protein
MRSTPFEIKLAHYPQPKLLYKGKGVGYPAVKTEFVPCARFSSWSRRSL